VSGQARDGRAASGRVVLITGGNRGIGLACAQHFAALGDRVAVTYRSNPPEGDFLCVPCDVTSTEQVDAAVKAVEERLGPVNVLVCNAGITKDGLLLRMSEDTFTSVVDANLTGSFRVAKRCAATMLRQRSGRIIFISSVVAYFGVPGQANYAASKAGLIGMARSMAKELASRNITVNVIAPGGVDTDMVAAMNDQMRDGLVASTPIGRLATPAEIAHAVGFLAAPEAASITGVVLPVDGGLAMGW
jgi:3-oxoacyl-[acyl-carrier protein] reductase